MGRVTITLYGTLANIAGEKTVEVEASILKEAIAQLTAKYGKDFASRMYDEKGKPRRFINIYINGKDMRFLGNFDTKLNNEDKVSIIPAVGGG